VAVCFLFPELGFFSMSSSMVDGCPDGDGGVAVTASGMAQRRQW